MSYYSGTCAICRSQLIPRSSPLANVNFLSIGGLLLFGRMVVCVRHDDGAVVHRVRHAMRAVEREAIHVTPCVLNDGPLRQFRSSNCSFGRACVNELSWVIGFAGVAPRGSHPAALEFRPDTVGGSGRHDETYSTASYTNLEYASFSFRFCLSRLFFMRCSDRGGLGTGSGSVARGGCR